MAAATTITPVTVENDEQTQPRLTIDPQITAPDGSFYVFDGQDGYRQVVEPHAVEAHIPPIKAHEKLGDIESWVSYASKYGDADTTLLTWSDRGLRAVLDYHSDTRAPGRCQWTAEHLFLRTRQWDAWQALAGRPLSQKALIEAIEDRRDEITAPDAATLLQTLQKLRATVNAQASAELDANGNTKLSYTRQTQTSLTLPPTLTIEIPVLKGHTAPDENGKVGPVPYRLEVRIRVDVLDEGKLSFRLSLPNADAVLEAAVADRVEKAEELLPTDFLLLRAAS